MIILDDESICLRPPRCISTGPVPVRLAAMANYRHVHVMTSAIKALSHSANARVGSASDRRPRIEGPR